MAIINIAVLTVIILLLTGLLIAATSATGNLVQSWQIHTADCQTIAAIDTTLHLLINILSTLVLASSNFFMQVLNAPTRAEVDHAHERGRWLDIGIPSWRNAYWLSPFKLLACLCLLLTSMPIHLMFNSAVFKMDHRMGDFHATIASGSFVEGGSYFLPGATLATNELINETNRKYGPGFGNHSLLPTFGDLLTRNYPAYALNISNAAVNASSWNRLEAPACWQIFQERSCTGLKDHRNVVMIARGPGWKKSELWNLSTTADELWGPVVPRDGLNSLWYSAQCDMTGIVNASGLPDCFHTCNNLFSTSKARFSTKKTNPWDIADRWNASLYAAPGDGSELGFLPDSFSVDIDYCLVEPREARCTVAVSKPLLLAVILSMTLKLAICTVVVRQLGPQEPLATLGDAISSFISVQAKSAFVSGLMTDLAVRDRCRKYIITKPVLPLRWSKKQYRRAGCVPRRAWFRFWGTHLLFLLVAVLFLVGKIPSSSLLTWRRIRTNTGSYEVVGTLRGVSSYATTAIVANTPQIWLSLCYYVYNALLTRLEMSWEWSLFAVRYCSLRVTKPKGQQISTHRLQLPYKFSIPSMTFSILTHWLLSNALFVIISRGCK
ncbi:hypothetical protein CMUS01_02787 [Colletotrichum musicola]|uniref:DUF6536 domain-containing protein n=1 Tax=Colletotrichum musicola TaxID=2175873 RepID=A0A8H6U749_9PEZI|nr:hypothetical protein CMUS01_02787 [Colletotrichum musicola]